MAYPGNSELSAQAQERVMTAFRQVITKLQEGQREEAMIGLEFVLRLDPAFSPAVNLQEQLSSGAAEIDLSGIVGELHAPSTEAIDGLLVEAVEDFDQRDFLAARGKVEQVLLELPGHEEARQLLAQVDEALKVEAQVGQFLAQAREALNRGDAQEAANFVTMAQALDPHHEGISRALEEIQGAGGAPPAPAALQGPEEPDDDQELDPAAFETIDETVPDFSAAFGEVSEEPAGPPSGPLFDAIGDDRDLEAAADFTVASDDEFAPIEPDHDPPHDFVIADAPAAEEGFGFGTADAASAEPESVAGASEADEDWESAAPGVFASTSEEVAAGEEDGLFSVGGAEIADLFDADEADAVEHGPAVGLEDEDEDARRVQELLEQGGLAFDREDYQEAIDVWSRIYLVDPTHEEVSRRIDEARQRKEEIDRHIEQTIYEANDAADAGDEDRALELVEEVLNAQPTHIEAVELKERLTGQPVAPPPAAAEPSLPDLEEDLFDEDFGAPPDGADADDAAVAAARPGAGARRRTVPWLTVGLGLGGLVVVLLGVWVGSRLLSPAPVDERAQAVNRALSQGEALVQQGRADEAVLMLQDLLEEMPESDPDRARLERRIAKYEESLAPPTPTAIPQAVASAEELFDQGLWLSAYSHVVIGLSNNPRDPTLLQLRDRIYAVEPAILALHGAVQKGDFSEGVVLAEELAGNHPTQPEFAQVLRRSLFNAALAELRGYNLTAAENHLQRLAELEPDDTEVSRILRFTRKYKSRPVDPRLRIFIRSLAER